MNAEGLDRYVMRVHEVEVNQEFSIPPNAENIEYEYFSTHPSIDGEWTRIDMVRVKYLEPINENSDGDPSE